MRARLLASSAAAAAFALPALASAATLTDTLVFLSTFLNGVIGLFITLAIVVFFWGLIKYLWSMDTETAHESLKLMFYGFVTIFVMVSIWGIIRLVQSSFKVTSTDPVIPKGIQVSPGVRY
jgi:fumarate reductase subunit D